MNRSELRRSPGVDDAPHHRQHPDQTRRPRHPPSPIPKSSHGPTRRHHPHPHPRRTPRPRNQHSEPTPPSAGPASRPATGATTPPADDNAPRKPGDRLDANLTADLPDPSVQVSSKTITRTSPQPMPNRRQSPMVSVACDHRHRQSPSPPRTYTSRCQHSRWPTGRPPTAMSITDR